MEEEEQQQEEKVMYDPVNRAPDEGPASGPQLSAHQRAVLDRKNCNALLERIKDERHGLPWWQGTPISYCFSDSVVRDRLLKLMKSEKVRLMDRNYMLMLSDRLIEANWELVHNRIEARRRWEIEREKQLVFEGKLPLSDGPPGFAHHPYFHEDNMVKKRLADEEARRRAKMSRKARKQMMIPSFEFPDHVKTSMVKLEEDGGLDADGIEADKDECAERAFLECQLEKEADDRIIDPPEYHEKHYEALGVRQIRHALTVDKMFKSADRIFLKLY